jgi:hypothetical protein
MNAYFESLPAGFRATGASGVIRANGRVSERCWAFLILRFPDAVVRAGEHRGVPRMLMS